MKFSFNFIYILFVLLFSNKLSEFIFTKAGYQYKLFDSLFSARGIIYVCFNISVTLIIIYITNRVIPTIYLKIKKKT